MKMKLELLSFFLLFHIFCNVNASESSEEIKEILSSATGRKFMKDQINQMYQEEPLELIASWIHSMTADRDDRNNVTVVGTQNIYNPDGSIKEIRTIELFIPNLDKKSAIAEIKESVKQEEEGDDEDDDINVSEMVEMFQQMSNLGLDIEVGAREYDTKQKQGKGITSAFFISPEIMFAFNEGILYINKTIEVDTVKDVEEKIKALQEDKNRNLPISVLKYDANHKFLSDKSDIKPELLAYMNDMEGDIPEVMRTTILHSVVKSSLENPNNTTEVCRNVVNALEKQFPAGRFLVIADDIDGLYINKDIYAEVAYSFTDLDEDDKVYKIYGVLTKHK